MASEEKIKIKDKEWTAADFRKAAEAVSNPDSIYSNLPRMTDTQRDAVWTEFKSQVDTAKGTSAHTTSDAETWALDMFQVICHYSMVGTSPERELTGKITLKKKEGSSDVDLDIPESCMVVALKKANYVGPNHLRAFTRTLSGVWMGAARRMGNKMNKFVNWNMLTNAGVPGAWAYLTPDFILPTEFMSDEERAVLRLKRDVATSRNRGATTRRLYNTTQLLTA